MKKPHKKTVYLLITSIGDYGGAWYQLVKLSQELRKRGFNVFVFCQKSIYQDSQYLRMLHDCRIKIIGPPLWCEKIIEKFEIFTKALTKPLLIIIALLDSLWRHRSFGRSLIGANGVLRHIFRVFVFDLRNFLWGIILTFNKIKHGVDLVHVFRADAVFGIYWASSKNIPVIYHERNTPRADSLWNVPYLSKALTKATVIAANSKAGAVGLKKYYGVEKEVAIIPGMFDDPGYGENNRGTEGDFVSIGCYSRIIEAKGIQYLLKSASRIISQFPTTRFLVGGDGPYKIELEELTRKLKIGNNVHFIGIFTIDQLDEIMSTIDIFVFPSCYYEGLPTSVIEATAYGKPVVATTVGGVPEIVRHGLSGILVPPCDIDELTEAILELVNNKELRLSMGKAGRQLYEENYTPHIVMGKIVALYDSLLSGDAERIQGPKIAEILHV